MNVMTTNKPHEWKGSDLRSRREVIQYLADAGGELQDKTGLVVGKMREDLGRGRSLAQLLAEMEADGMIEREVRGRRTFRIRLLDDWGLTAPAPEHATVTPDGPASNGVEPSVEGVDLTALAEALLGVVVKKMTAAENGHRADGGPSPRELAERLRRADKALRQAQEQLRERSEEVTRLRDQLSEAEDRTRALTNNVEVLNAEVRKLGARRQPTREVPVAEVIGEEGRTALAKLMRALPETPASKPRPAADGSGR